MIEPIRFSAFVAPHLNKTRVDAQWARIAEKRPIGRKIRSAAIPAVGVLIVACALGVVWWPRETRSSNESVWEGSVVASDDAPVGMTLAEGTHIKVEPRSEVKLLRSSSSAVQVRLTHGSARFVVAKRPTRRFSVNVGEVEVVVTGTQFRVVRRPSGAADRVQVEVIEGSVEVRRGDGVVTLRSGDQWSTTVAPEPGEPPRPRLADERESERESDTEDDTEELDMGADDGELYGEPSGDGSSVMEADGDGQRPRESPRAKRRRRAREAARDAGELFDHANLARRVGRLEDAVAMYGELVAKHPRDKRASLAAFELGRLRMDSLRDMRGAVRALERALKLDAHGAFAEDALARLVLAEEARHDLAGCNRARSRYLARYPDGVHAQHVAERCGH
jgi:TolA-binding protein